MTRLLRASAAALLIASAAALPAAPASAAMPDGWVRLAHLSPDTASVDVTLSRLSGAALYRLSNVGYGNVSGYMRLPEGTYAVAMRPAGASPSSAPVVSSTVTVAGNEAETLGAFGLNKNLSLHLLADDLSAPGDRSRVRVVAASVKHPEVTVRADSTTVGDDVAFARASKYAALKPATVTLDASAGSDTGSREVDLRAGAAQTVFVLDNADGGLTLAPVLDSAASPVKPVGGLATGGGALATTPSPAVPLGLAAIGAALVAVLLPRRKRAAA